MEVEKHKQLKVAEVFYSLQGEGKTIGRPAYFIRLSNCNMLCKGEWICDTIDVWRTGKYYEHSALLEKLNMMNFELGALKAPNTQSATIVFTGGEPLLQSLKIALWLEFVSALYLQIQYIKINPYIEIETNGTIIPSECLHKWVTHYNVSPKLKNSGVKLSKRMVEKPARWFAKQPNAYYKFVVTNVTDLREIETEWIEQFNIPKERVMLMPSADTREALINTSQWLAEVCKEQLYTFTNRLQLEIWNKATGV